ISFRGYFGGLLTPVKVTAWSSNLWIAREPGLACARRRGCLWELLSPTLLQFDQSWFLSPFHCGMRDIGKVTLESQGLELCSDERQFPKNEIVRPASNRQLRAVGAEFHIRNPPRFSRLQRAQNPPSQWMN